MSTGENVNTEMTALNEVKKIIGSNGQVEIIDSTKIKVNNLHYINKPPFKPLSLEEFKIVFNNTRKKIQLTSEAVLINKNVNQSNAINASSIKAHDELEEDGPRPAGYYHAVFPFYMSYFTGLNSNAAGAGLYNMYLDFNTDASGRIIGTPTISFTGIGLFSFTQINMSAIKFNPASGANTFTITGINVLGVQFGGLTIGWSSRSNYIFNVNMDEANSKDAVHVEQN